MKPLRILGIDTETVWRGGQDQFFNLMAGLRERGHTVELAAPGDAPLGRKAAAVGIPVHPFRQRSEWSPAALLRLLAIVGKERFDVLHDNTPRSILIGALASRLRGVPVHVSSRRVVFPLRSFFSRFKYNVFQDRVLCVCQAVRDVLAAAGVRDDKLEVVYEGIDASRFDQQPAEGLPARTKGEVWIGISAALTAEKGHLDLLAAFAELAEEELPVRLLILGAGPLESELRNWASDRRLEGSILFAGFRQDADHFIRNADIFCLPSHAEGFSSAILSAMANRLPVVATRVGGSPEMVQDGVTGLLVEPADPTALATALRRLVLSESARSEMGRAGRRRVEREFTVAGKLARTEAIYRQLLESRSFG